jgi:hypothetical protein
LNEDALELKNQIGSALDGMGARAAANREALLLLMAELSGQEAAIRLGSGRRDG